MATPPLDAPYDRLAALPRALWLPGLTCSAGSEGTGQPDPTAQRRFSPVHLAARQDQVAAVTARAAAAAAQMQAAHDLLAAQCAQRLWLPPTLADGWLAAHRATLATLAGLQARLAATARGFAALPVDDQRPAVPPAAMAWQDAQGA